MRTLQQLENRRLVTNDSLTTTTLWNWQAGLVSAGLLQSEQLLLFEDLLERQGDTMKKITRDVLLEFIQTTAREIA